MKRIKQTAWILGTQLEWHLLSKSKKQTLACQVFGLGRAHTARKFSLHPVLIHVSDIGHVSLSNVSVTFSENPFGVGCELPAPIV